MKQHETFMGRIFCGHSPDVDDEARVKWELSEAMKAIDYGNTNKAIAIVFSISKFYGAETAKPILDASEEVRLRVLGMRIPYPLPNFPATAVSRGELGKYRNHRMDQAIRRAILSAFHTMYKTGMAPKATIYGVEPVKVLKEEEVAA